VAIIGYRVAVVALAALGLVLLLMLLLAMAVLALQIPLQVHLFIMLAVAAAVIIAVAEPMEQAVLEAAEMAEPQVLTLQREMVKTGLQILVAEAEAVMLIAALLLVS
jgi:hypothetical protein